MVNRRGFLVLGATGLLAGCASSERLSGVSALFADGPDTSDYAAITTEPYPVPAVDTSRIPARFLRREVSYGTDQPPGTIVVDLGQRYAYLVEPNGMAMRYGVGIGREEGLNFQGEAVIARKAAWPRWTPTPDMIASIPRYKEFAGGMDGGPGNPLGPRALYLYQDGRDTLFRLHGTLEPWTIGTTVSSGCIRFINQDIIDLYRRVPTGTRVVVLQPNAGLFG